MPDPLSYVAPGSPLRIPAAWYNRVTSLLRPPASPPNGPRNSGFSELLPFRVTAQTVLTTDKRWRYTLKEQVGKVYATTGDIYQDKAGGLEIEAYNLAEERNDQSGEYGGYFGNGVPSTITSGNLTPIPVGRVVMCWRESCHGGYQWTILPDNGVECSGDALAAALALKANLVSPTFTGTPAAPTAGAGSNTTQLATTAFVRAEVAAVVDSSPGVLDTLNELAAALGDDANFAATVATSLAGKQPIDATLTALSGLDAAAIRALLEIRSKCGVTIDGGSVALATGVRGPTVIEEDATITDWYIDADVSTTSTVDVYVNGSKISASAPLSLSAATAANSSTLTGWTVNVSKGDRVTFDVTANNNAKRLGLTLIKKER